MKKLMILLLALVLLAVPVAAEDYYVVDDSGLLQDHDVQKLEQLYSTCPETYGFTAALVTTDSFGGLKAWEFAESYYEMMDYPQDGILYLVSVEEGAWYIFNSGECFDRIPNEDLERIGQELAELLRDGQYYAAFLKFPELAAEVYEANAPAATDADQEAYVAPTIPKKSYGKTVAICMAVGLAIGGITVGIMSVSMKTVRPQSGASDYMRPGSMNLRVSRDIFLYSHVSRTPKPKNNSSSGGHSGGSRGGAGGRI